VGDVVALTIDPTSGKVETLHAVTEKEGHSDPGGLFSPVRDTPFNGLQASPGFFGKSGGDLQPAVIDATVQKGTLVFLASDALYDNLPGDSSEEKNAALQAIVRSPEYDEPKEREGFGSFLPTLAVLQYQVVEGPITKAQALTRVRNYMARAMPTMDEVVWNSETAFATLPGDTFDEKLAAREAIVSNPKYDTRPAEGTGDKLDEPVPLEELQEGATKPTDDQELKLQRFQNYLYYFRESAQSLRRTQDRSDYTMDDSGKPDDSTGLMFEA